MRTTITSPKAPQPIGPYCQAVFVSNMLFVSGQIPIDPLTGKVVDGGIKEQVHQVMVNIRAILNEAGLDFSDVAKATIFIADMNDFEVINQIYGSYLTTLPARETVEVSRLPKNSLLEISVIAVKM